MDSLSDLQKAHRLKKAEIEDRLLYFRKVGGGNKKRIFEELCFCLLTAGANAEKCKKIIIRLKQNSLLFRGKRHQLRPFLKHARFYDQKACRIVEARGFFSKRSRTNIKEKIFCGNPLEARKWLVGNVNGLGYKEASHFLRNIGLGEGLAILDRHVLRRLKNYGAIDELPVSLTPKKYLQIEEKMVEFSKRSGIPLSHLDLLFFSSGTGKPVKYCK